MKFVIPVLVRQMKSTDSELSYYVTPLFQPGPSVSGKILDRCLSKLSSELRRDLTELARDHRLDSLSRFHFEPNYYDKNFYLEFHYKKGTVKGEFLVVILPDSQPRSAFIPQLAPFWFQLSRKADLRTRTAEVLDDHFARVVKPNGPVEYKDKYWTTEVEIQFAVPPKPPKERRDKGFMILGGPPVAEGWQELERVGRCLDDRYPQDLSECLCRDDQIKRIVSALGDKSRAPQLILGPSKVGKSALIHQIVRLHRENKKTRTKRRFWLLSPQRLISGMSYVGQWEARLLAILKHAIKEDFVLVLNDLLGLFSAGVSRDSNLCVADLLKPYVQKGQIRILAECSEQALAILREKDRGFADLFTLTRLRPTAEAQTLEIAINEIRQGESLHNCEFQLEALRTAYDLQKRYVRDSAFPGKLASFLRKIAARNRGASIDRKSVLDYFHSTSGLALDLLDDKRKLLYRDVESFLSAQVFGQDQAVKAATNVVMMSKARLCDPTRPLASLLFVGPTGVGKTECAKALCRYLFGHENRLLRFDMNEYVHPYSVAKLVGTFQEPEGLLTSAVRRQPYSLLLLDEIEKAHPDVFNLLLQVLGEGRLTDARGRTVDFTQCIIILTSNLGVREASRPIGFRSKDSEEDLTYLRAVESFFSPEFFNRLDKILPFSRLNREDIEGLARGLINKVLAREGLVRRQCILQVHEEAMDHIAELGYHPQLGARALKRAIEAQISAPVSRQLSQMSPLSPTVISIEGQSELEVKVHELLAADPRENVLSSDFDKQSYLSRAEAKIKTVEDSLSSPSDTVTDKLSDEQLWYYATQDRIRRAKAILNRVRQLLRKSVPAQKKAGSEHHLLPLSEWSQVLKERHLKSSLKMLREQRATNTSDILWQKKWAELQAELSLLETEALTEECELQFCYPDSAGAEAYYLQLCLEEAFGQTELVVHSEKNALKLSGPFAGALGAVECGYHLFAKDDGMQLVEIRSTSTTCTSVIRIYDEHASLDLRTGWLCSQMPDAVDLKTLMLLAFQRREGAKL